MFRKKISAVFLSVLLCVTVFSAFAADAPSYTATIKNSGEGRFKAVRLTPDIYNKTNSDLSDLRIKDSAGEPVPYFIRSDGGSEYETTGQSHAMSLINAYTRDDSFYFDYVVSSIPTHDIIATSIVFTTINTGFAKNIEVFGSYDNIHWEFVQNDSLYKIDNKEKLNIEFYNIQKYTHYRFKLANNLERISFDSVTLLYNTTTQERIYFVEEILPAFSVEERDNTTYIYIEGLKNLRLADITINTDSMFQRMVSVPIGINKELYNLTFGDTTYTDTTLFFDRRISYDDTFELIIRNNDDRPINIIGIIARYYADDLVFENSGSDGYTLFFGADNTLAAPVYDIERYKDEIIKEDIDRLEITEILFAEPIETPEPRDYSLFFNIAIITVAAVLGVILLLKLKKT